MAAKRRGKGEGGTVIIRREEIVSGGHHGGAWKVAYADFVTAMMAFFLLMWLLNATTEQQRRGIAAYFSPMANVENGFSGTGLVPGGLTPLDKGSILVTQATTAVPSPPSLSAAPRSEQPDLNALPSTPSRDDADAGKAADARSAGQDDAGRQQPGFLDGGEDGSGRSGAATDGSDGGGSADAAGKAAAGVVTAVVAGAGIATAAGPGAGGNPETAAVAQPPGRSAEDGSAAARDAASSAAVERRALSDAAAALFHAVATDPALRGSAGQMAIDAVPEGLRIQIMDRDNQPMFERGSARLDRRAVALLQKVAPFLAGLPEPVSIGGYTDGAPCPPGAPSNWSLSSGRADAARDVLAGAGLPDARIADVSGFADRHLLLPAQPLADANRRIVLTLHRLHADPLPFRPAVPPPGPARAEGS